MIRPVLLRQWPRCLQSKPYAAVFPDRNEIFSFESERYSWENGCWDDELSDFKIQTVIEQSRPVYPSDPHYAEVLEYVQQQFEEDIDLVVYSSLKAYKRDNSR